MKKILAALLALTLIIGASACNKKKIPDDENSIEIYAVPGGYGQEWLDKSAREFEKKYPQYKVYVWSDEGGYDRGVSLLQAGPKHTSADLIFSQSSFFSFHDMGSNAIKGYDNILANLTDIYDANVPDEEIKLKDKMNQDYRERLAIEEEVDGVWKDQYYMFPWAQGINGVVYNKTILDKYMTHEPRTTDELLEAADMISSQTKHTFPQGELGGAFSTSVKVGYWSYFIESLWGQYETRQGYINFWEGKDEHGDYSHEVYSQMGRLYALQTVDAILNPQYKRSHQNTSSMGYAEAQARIISGDAVFNVSGEWFENEMKDVMKESGKTDEIRIMKMPIISALSDKLSYWGATDSHIKALDYATAKADSAIYGTVLEQYESYLRDLVDYVDGVLEQKPTYASEAEVDSDIAIVREARYTVSSAGDKCQAIIPAYSNNVTGAKLFLQYLATDEAGKIFIQETGGTQNSFDYDVKADTELYSSLSNFQKAKFDIASTARYLPAWANMRMYWKAGMPNWAYGYTTFLLPKNDKNYKSPLQVFEQSKLSQTEFENYLRNAGLI